MVTPEYMSAIIGLHAASVQPVPNPIHNIEISKLVYPVAKTVSRTPRIWATKATRMIFFGPKE
jgi:hypothetical protein